MSCDWLMYPQYSPLIGPDGGCPIHYYVIEYKEESQPTWRIVSNNIRYAAALYVRAANDPSVFTITEAHTRRRR